MDRIRRALVSVFDKDGVVELCRRLRGAGVEILSSGGTAKLLQQQGIEVRLVSDYTGHPEMLDGRVKTLHPKIHAGILAVRQNSGHMADLETAGYDPIDLVVVNLYPFVRTAADPTTTLADAVEMIDIGGPTMVRAAAKNFAGVGVVVDPADYDAVATEIEQGGGLGDETRKRLAAAAFAHTSSYDAAIHEYLTRDAETVAPERLVLSFPKVQDLRYGEKPHQRAAFYRDEGSTGPSVARATQLQGKELSFNNILDLDAALALAADFKQPSCAIIKHGNPSGAAIGGGTREAFDLALQCDPLSAFGGVIAFNRHVDGDTARTITENFYEAVIAPSFDDEAREAFGKKKKLRLLETGDLAAFVRDRLDLRRVTGGILAQDWDTSEEDVLKCEAVTARKPSDEEWKALAFAWVVCKHVKSNAIVYATHNRTVGVGAGQMSRIDSARIAMQKAQSPLEGCVMASDAFFPFRDGLDVAAEAGITAVVQPGGSIRDKEVIAAADEHGIAMVFTGQRHFRH